MCYYHVFYYHVKHKHLLKGEDVYVEFEADVNKLHFSCTEAIFEERLRLFKTKYAKSQKAMFKYFEDEWLKGNFTKWQIFRNAPGFANTNSNIESFNATFKRDFTKRIRGSLITACTKLYNCISYYSLPTNNIWYSYPEFDKQIKDWALKINKSCFTKFGRTGRKFKYTGKVRTIFILTDDKRCNKSVSCNCVPLLSGHYVRMSVHLETLSYWIFMVRNKGKAINL